MSCRHVDIANIPMPKELLSLEAIPILRLCSPIGAEENLRICVKRFCFVYRLKNVNTRRLGANLVEVTADTLFIIFPIHLPGYESMKAIMTGVGPAVSSISLFMDRPSSQYLAQPTTPVFETSSYLVSPSSGYI